MEGEPIIDRFPMTLIVNKPEVVTLTADLVLQWQGDLAQAQAIVQDRTRKLAAAAVFLPHMFLDISAAPEPSAGPTVQDWVLKALADSPKGLTPREIRRGVEAAGGNAGAENYLYTTLKRMLDRNLITKQGEIYALASASSPKGEAGGTSAAAPTTLDLLSGAGPLARSPEAGGT
jgi:hypothetical protein